MGDWVVKWRAGAALFLFCACAALGSGPPGQSPAASSVPAAKTNPAESSLPSGSGSYYHFMLARRYEELAGIYNRTEYVQRAISEYKQAIAEDPQSLYLHVQLGDLYWRIGQTSEAEGEAQYALKNNPNDLDAHRLLGGIYLRDLGAGGNQQKENLSNAIQQYEAIVRLAPQDTHSAILLARLYALANEPAKAEAEFKQVLGKQPDSSEALSYLGKLYIDQENYNGAIALFERIPQAERDSSTEAMLGLAYGQTGQYEKAEASFQAALKADPTNTAIQREYATALMRGGKLDQARAEFEAVLKTDPTNREVMLRLAQIDQAQGLFSQAGSLLDQAAKLLPGDMEVPYQRALLDAAMGNNAQAIVVLKDLIAKTASGNGAYTAAEAENRSTFLERLGIIYRTEEQYDQAISTFRQIAGLGTAHGPRSEELVIETLDLAGRKPQALSESESALKKYPDSFPLILSHASLLGQQGRSAEAVAELRKLQAGKDPGMKMRIEFAIVQVYSQAKQYREAQSELENLLKQDLKPSDQEYAQFLLGATYERQKKYNLAEQEFKQVLTADPFNSDAFNYLGYMLADRGVQLKQSVGYIEKALKLEPNNGAYLDSLGWAYFKMSRYDLALEPLQKAARLLKNDPTVLDHLGNVYLKLGKKQQAAEEWRRALQNWTKSSDSEFDAAAAAKLQKRLSQLERQLPKQQSM